MGDRALAEVAINRGLVGGPFGSNLVGKDYVDAGIPVIRGTNLAGRFVGGEFAYVTAEKFANDLARNNAGPGDLIFTQRGTLGQLSVVPSGPFDEYVISQSQMRLRVDRSTADPTFVYYACSSPEFVKQINDNAIATGVPHINLGILSRLTIPDMPIPQQRAIAEVLSAFDDKIAANDRVIGTMAELAVAAYERGLSRGNRIERVEEIGEFHNRRRVPLSSRQRDERKGTVPYYGAAGRVGFVDVAIFDEPLLLVGEDGSVIREDGRPVVQYIWGPSWVNNHAHVLTGKGISTELLRVGIERTNVAHLVTGAVQPKISMGKLKSLEVALPADPAEPDALIRQLTASTRALSDENAALDRTMDELLRLLMSGRVRVKDAEMIAEATL